LALTPGSRLGPYEVLAQIGEGGMGQVYRARDTKLNRDVALKILPDTFALDADRRARFTREAHVLAGLNHPNIAAIFGLEDSGPAHALAMELVDGDDLSAIIAQGPMPLAEALPIARQVAEALEAAHDSGVVHRDLKPSNIKVRADGTVKVLDFGLAKPMDTAGVSSAGAMTSPTLTARATQAGMILGTAAYMAPEQARGKAVDKRADIWAFGAVLYEMLTGCRAFPGDEISDVLAAVLRQEIDWSALPDGTPPRLRQLLERCLDRDVRTRLRDIGEARVALIAAATPEASAAAVPAASSSLRAWVRDWRSIAALVALLATGTLAAFAVARSTGRDADLFPARIEIPTTGAAALSPDGHSVVFVGRAPAGAGTALYLRRLDQLTARAIPGTENVNPSDPLFSPDGGSILFIANRRTLVKVPLDGAPVTLGEIGDMGGGLDWSAADEIVAGTGVMQGLQGLLRVNAGGGPLREFTHVDKTRRELSHQWPRLLADGKTVLFTIWHGSVDTAELGAVSLDDGKVAQLGIVAARALDVVDGQLVYVQADGVAMAVPFDVATRRTTGPAIPVQNAIATGGGNTIGYPRAFLTHAGGLMFQTGQPRRRLVWADTAGRVAPAFKEVRAFSFLRLSPDGSQAAVGIDTGNASDVWLIDLGPGTLTRLTTTGQTRNPSWSSDGRRVFYSSTHGGRGEFWWQPADASGPPVKAGEPPHNPWWADVSPDGRVVMFNAVYNGSWNLETLSLDGTREARDFAASAVTAETMGRFSPDGSLVAYVSNESGREEVYVRPFPQGARVLISAEGGRRPIWSASGTQIFFWQGDQLISASIARQPSLHVTSRQRILAGNYAFDFDVAKDGRFLMIEQEDSGQSLVVVPNWRTELRRLTAGGKGR
jgi:eukaryotic-like serine/threonine-protein kinase